MLLEFKALWEEHDTPYDHQNYKAIENDENFLKNKIIASNNDDNDSDNDINTDFLDVDTNKELGEPSITGNTSSLSSSPSFSSPKSLSLSPSPLSSS
jgi:hypothetical protein